MIHQILLVVVSFFTIFSAVSAFNSRGYITRNKFLSKKSSFILKAKATYKVTIQHDGKEKVINVREDCSILEAALDAGIDLPHDCKLGVCLTCPSKIVSGLVDHSGSTLDDSVLEKGYALTCCVFPRSDVVIKSIEEEELISNQFSGRY